jgi:hypothetical protein
VYLFHGEQKMDLDVLSGGVLAHIRKVLRRVSITGPNRQGDADIMTRLFHCCLCAVIFANTSENPVANRGTFVRTVGPLSN